MKRLFVIGLTAVALFAITADASARGWGHRGHHGHHGHGGHFSLHLGGPGWWGPSPYYYVPRPYYYYEPRTVIIERQAPVYVERQPEVVSQAPSAPAQAAPTIWYYCTEPAGYYPHVQTCNAPWVHVDPRTVAPPVR